MDREKITALFETYIRKLRITPAWDVRLEFVEDPSWTKTGDFKIDCDDRKAIPNRKISRKSSSMS